MMATKTQTNVQAALTADQTVNYVIPIYDVLTQWSLRRSRSPAGRTDKVKIATFNRGTPVRDRHGSARQDRGGHRRESRLDRPCRRRSRRCACCAGLPVVKDSKIPLLIFDKDNADTAGKPPQVSTGLRRRAVRRGTIAKLWKLHCLQSRRTGRERPSPFDISRSSACRRHSAARGRSTRSASTVRYGEVPRSARTERFGQIDPDQNSVRLSRRQTARPRIRIDGRECHSADRAQRLARARRCACPPASRARCRLLTVLEDSLLLPDARRRRSLAGRLARGSSPSARSCSSDTTSRLDPLSPLSRLKPVERAQLAIVRAFDQLRRARGSEGSRGLLVLDEPTPFLPAHDVQALFKLVREIVADGASVIFVSHDIDEVPRRSPDHGATVLRDGRVAGAPSRPPR